MKKFLQKSLYTSKLKPILDWLFVLIILILASLLMLLIAFVIKLNDGGKVLFKQQRPGKNEKIFTLYKFRTMNENAEMVNRTEYDMERMTKFGKFLRKFSLDELPQLINILKGEMSFVGPRPLLAEYLEFYSEEQSIRHLVKPGMTGFAQVYGRNSSTWEERLKKDSEYVRRVSFMLDLKIVLRTIINIIAAKDVNSSNEQTMIRFDDYVRNKK